MLSIFLAVPSQQSPVQCRNSVCKKIQYIPGGNPVTRVGVTSGISNTSREEKEGSKCTSRSIMEVHHKAHAWTSTSAALKWASYLCAAHIALLRHRRLPNTSEALNNVIPGKNHIVRITSECTIERYYNQWEPHNMLKPQESPTQQSCWTSKLRAHNSMMEFQRYKQGSYYSWTISRQLASFT